MNRHFKDTQGDLPCFDSLEKRLAMEMCSVICLSKIALSDVILNGIEMPIKAAFQHSDKITLLLFSA